MNYIREELLRQQTALAVLMSGGDESREMEKWQEQQAAELTREEREWPLRSRESADLGGLSQQYAVTPTSEEIPLFETMSAEEWEPSGRRNALWSGDVPTTEHGMVVRGLTGPAPAGAVIDVRELSRSIQRDARRYDGGFSMY